MTRKKHTFALFGFVGLIGVVLCLFMFASIFSFMPKVSNFISATYLMFALVGHFSLIWLLLATLGFVLYKLTRSLIPSSVLFSLALLLFYLDTKVYSIYRSHLSRGLLEYAVNEAFGELKRIGSAGLFPATFAVICMVTFVFYMHHFIEKNFPRSLIQKSKYVYITAFVFFLSSQFIHIYVDVINYIPIKKWTRHIPFYNPLTSRRALFKYGIVDPSKVRSFELKTVSDDTSINYPKDIACNKQNEKLPNILWLFIDTWRFDAYNKETTPNIYNWVQKEQPHIFNNHWSVGNETIPSLFAMFYGVPGLYIKSFTESGTTPIFISKLLKENYEMQILTGWPLDNTSLTKNVFREVPNLRVSIGDKKAWESDLHMKEEIFSFLETRDKKKPYFSFMIFDSAHDYSLPPDYLAPFKPFAEKLDYFALGPNSDPTPYRNKYNNSVHYIDDIIGDILDSPQLQDETRPTIILIASDHGEQFNDLKKNFWGHSSNFSKFQLRVPMFVKWNGFRPERTNLSDDFDAPKTLSHMTTHNDLAHTFLESVFNCTPSSQQSVGKNLYQEEKRLPLLLSTYSRHGILTEKSIYSYRIGYGYEVFDYNYNEKDADNIPKSIFNQYLKASSKFFN